ncbi:hypothetical protein LCGC14_1789930 [marine sediment metagenome]|uniref:Uncharacterized protein n=1 Tax=marine sediment metagenome TaxID=412755 RepID=A0A0F9JSF8_9ZZZZ
MLPGDYMPNDMTTKSEFHDVYEINDTAWRLFNEQACLDLDYFLKAQHSHEEMERADLQHRLLHTIDKIGRQVNLLHGYEIRNRHILKIGPQGNFDEAEDQACNQHTGVIMSLMARQGGYDVLSEAFKWGTLVQGHNLIELWRDRNGTIQYGRLGWNQFLLDAGLTDLSDCNDILTGQWITSLKAKMLVPTAADEIEGINPLTHTSRWPFQGTPPMMNKAGKRLYEQWWHRTTEEVEVVQNRFTGEQTTFEEFLQNEARGDKNLANLLLRDFRTPDGAPILVKFRDIKDKIELKIFVDDEWVWEGDNPMKIRDYNYTWVHGMWCPECPRTELKLQSFVRGLRDPQTMYNRRVNQIMDLIESQIQGVRMTRSEKLVNPEDAYLSGQGIVLQVDDDKTDDAMPFEQIFRQFPASEVPQSMFTAAQMIDKDQTESGGLNQEIFGTDEKNIEISGVLAHFRTGQALTAQGWMFQYLRDSKRDFGKKQVQIVQLNYDPVRIRKILNEEPVQGFYDDDLTRFDCAPTEGLLTDSQQNMYYQELRSLLKDLPEEFRGIITAEMLVKASPMQFKTPTLQAIQAALRQRQQLQQAQSQSQKITDELTQGLTAVQISQAQENIADAQEKRSEIPLNRMKTLAQAQKIQAEPLVALVKEEVRLQIAQDKNRQVANQP